MPTRRAATRWHTCVPTQAKRGCNKVAHKASHMQARERCHKVSHMRNERCALAHQVINQTSNSSEFVLAHNCGFQGRGQITNSSSCVLPSPESYSQCNGKSAAKPAQGKRKQSTPMGLELHWAVNPLPTQPRTVRATL